MLVPVRRSKSVTLRSAEAARAVSGVDGSARARNGFSEAVCERAGDAGRMPKLDYYTPSCASMRVWIWCTYDCVRTETALHVPSSDGRIKSTTDAKGTIPASSSSKFYGRYTRRVRAQYRRGRLCPGRSPVLLLHLPPLFAFRRRDRLERNLIGFGNRRRPQPD